MTFDQAFDNLMRFEGGYANNLADPGGETNMGITVAVARAYGYTGAMVDLPKETAKEIYKKRYWDAVQADALPDSVRYDVFDTAVNSGVSYAVGLLQSVVNTRQDGIMGPVTIAAAIYSPSIKQRYNGARLRFLTGLSTWPSFSRGWARRIADNLMEA